MFLPGSEASSWLPFVPPGADGHSGGTVPESPVTGSPEFLRTRCGAQSGTLGGIG